MDKEHEQVHFRLPVHPELPYGQIELEKRYQVRKDTLKVSYVLINRGTGPETGLFIPSVDLSFPGEGEAFIRLVSGPVPGGVPDKAAGYGVDREGLRISGTAEITLEDLKNEVCLTLKSDLDFEAWVLPVRTRCPVQGTFLELYQSTCIMPIRPFYLEPGDCLAVEFSLRLY